MIDLMFQIKVNNMNNHRTTLPPPAVHQPKHYYTVTIQSTGSCNVFIRTVNEIDEWFDSALDSTRDDEGELDSTETFAGHHGKNLSRFVSSNGNTPSSTNQNK